MGLFGFNDEKVYGGFQMNVNTYMFNICEIFFLFQVLTMVYKFCFDIIISTIIDIDFNNCWGLIIL